jgi:hypothetical protein
VLSLSGSVKGPRISPHRKVTSGDERNPTKKNVPTGTLTFLWITEGGIAPQSKRGRLTYLGLRTVRLVPFTPLPSEEALLGMALGPRSCRLAEPSGVPP